MSTLHRGIDTTENCAPHIAALKADGFSFVCRYSSFSAWKNMTRAEALALSKADIHIVAVWETAGDHASFFTHVQGLQDGAAAHAFARHIGQPVPSPIYFAVDADLPGPGGVEAYFRGVRESLSAHGNIGKTVYNVGVYGSGAVCKHLSEIGLVSFTWLAQSYGWSHSREYKDSGDWNILQLQSTTVSGMSVDTDIAAAKGGGGFLVT